jgi:hypothetical protein
MWHGNTTAALSIRRELVHRSGEGTTLCNIGVLYFFVTDTIDTSDTSDTFFGSQDVKVRVHQIHQPHGHGDRKGAWRPQGGMATARGHGDRKGAWRPQGGMATARGHGDRKGSPLLYDTGTRQAW